MRWLMDINFVWPFPNNINQQQQQQILALIQPARNMIILIPWRVRPGFPVNHFNVSNRILQEFQTLAPHLISYFKQLRRILPAVGNNEFIGLCPLPPNASTANPLYIPIDYRVIRQTLVPIIRQAMGLYAVIEDVLHMIPERTGNKGLQRQVFELFFKKQAVRFKARGNFFFVLYDVSLI